MVPVLPSVVLQKSSKNSKAKGHFLKVEQQMKLLQECHILDIILDSQLMQHCLVASKRQTTKDISKTLAKVMQGGKVNAALKLLTTV